VSAGSYHLALGMGQRGAPVEYAMEASAPQPHRGLPRAVADGATRARLHGHRFPWTPRRGVWQRLTGACASAVPIAQSQQDTGR
jgi:hypothetical protein